ncbi:MAG: manganese efflux pump MntP family protein [Deltaproteobacteria bacterium]|jgi:putative Mn2+ efflux pump MntP|nr:manganese efflux pump MntP family protein [Deltaproteobacteria bacterium]
MGIFALPALSVALAMDAFAVALATGIQLRRVTAAQTARMAGVFGFFQFAMPVAGWCFGAGIQEYIEEYDHWVAFALLAFIGGRMVREAWRAQGGPQEEQDLHPSDPTRGYPLLVLGVATSIDALAVGLSMAILDQEILVPALVIGLVCCALTACGIHLGRITRSLAGNWANRAGALGGLVLIAIGLAILRDHGVFG